MNIPGNKNEQTEISKVVTQNIFYLYGIHIFFGRQNANFIELGILVV